jgi:hypothetical protein
MPKIKKVMRIISFLVLIPSLVFISCRHEVMFEKVPMRNIAYALPEDVYRITTIDKSVYEIKNIKIIPEENFISGYETVSRKPVKIAISKVVDVERMKK